MIPEQLKVRHKAFGEGYVTGVNGKYFTVKFANMEKIFVYPDVFEKYLTLEDGSVSEEILADLKSVHREKEAVEEAKRDENRRAMELGIVIPGKDMVPETKDEESNGESEEV